MGRYGEIWGDMHPDPLVEYGEEEHEHEPRRDQPHREGLGPVREHHELHRGQG